VAAESVSGPAADERRALLDQVESLVNRNDYRSAIALLVEANRRAEDPVLEQRLIDLRIQGFPQTPRPAPPTHWQPDFSDRFEEVEGLPAIDAGELDTDALLAGILGKGGLIVRGLMDAPTVETMRHNIDRALLGRKDFAEGVPGADANPWYSRSGSVAGGPVQFGTMGSNQYTGAGSVWAVDSPPTAFQLIEFYHRIGLPALLDSYFGEAAVLSVRKWVLRCVEPNNGAVSGWHQDGQFLGDESIRTVNLWIALTDCGGDADAPGIEIVGGNDRTIYETGTRGAVFDWTVGQELVDELGQTRPVCCPRFNAGDAIFFDHYNLHRTGFGTDHSSNRYAVESWFFASSTAPAKQQPLLFQV